MNPIAKAAHLPPCLAPIAFASVQLRRRSECTQEKVEQAAAVLAGERRSTPSREHGYHFSNDDYQNTAKTKDKDWGAHAL